MVLDDGRPGGDPTARNAASGNSDARLPGQSRYFWSFLPDNAGSAGAESGIAGSLITLALSAISTPG